MNKKISELLKDRYTLMIIALIIFGSFIRVFALSSFPSGINQDEAFAGYEAFSILNFGYDSFGYKNPVYLTTWGSGMSTAQTYFTVFLSSFLGESLFTLRLGQALLSSISLVFFYLLLKEVFNKKIAFIGLFLLVISPWHIMAARWALDANYLIYFLIFGLYFFIKGIKNNKYWLLSALMYGLSLYCYAIAYLIVPLTLVCFVLYILISKQKFDLKYGVLASVILFVLALPLILFVLVNNGLIPEIVNDFISIFKLAYYRSSHVNFSDIFSFESLQRVLNIIITQSDGLPWNSTEKYGLFYTISTPLMFLGFAKLLFDIKTDFSKKEFSYKFLILMAFIVSFVVSLTIAYQNVNKINSMPIFLLIFITIGADFLLNLFNRKVVSLAFFITFSAYFVLFITYYATDYNTMIGHYFHDGVYEAVEFANELNSDEIIVDKAIHYPQILYADKTNTDEFIDTVVFTNYPAFVLDVSSFTNFIHGIDYNNLEDDATYITTFSNNDYFIQQGYYTQVFTNFIVAYK